jgi:pimeloyl-ACP methyl ester carboxylesterase
MDRLITLRDRRDIAFREWGDPQGEPILFFHGFPGSRFQPRTADKEAARLGARLIALDRPGIGLSSKLQRGPQRVGQWAEDVVEFVDHLGLERYHIVGVSGGAAYALACAAKNDPRLRRVLVVCGASLFTDKVVCSKMNPLERRVLWLARTSPLLFRWFYRYLVWGFQVAPDVYVDKMINMMPPADQAIAQAPEMKRSIVQTFKEAYAQGVHVATEDFLRTLRPWGFDLSQIDRPVEFWHGGLDQLIPASATRALAERLPRATFRIFPNDGHYSLPLAKIRPILEHFVADAEVARLNSRTSARRPEMIRL